MSEHFTESQIQELKEAFKLFDSDNDGKINGQDVAKLINQLKLEIPESSITLNQAIDFNGFLNTMSARTTKSLNDKEVDYKAAFAAFDKDNKGNISAEDIARVLMSINETISESEIREIIKYADVSGDGQVNYEEFVKLMVEGV
ncbi:Calmodulin-2 [Entomophthora muscae]|uniref:Calmodulin-2 n=2 Tax=Entomophthora muscae TaxID=34485 RepID=A0ACC2TR04_9FUNG|nr:Calmodulin-2 [Entomophthora muscae]KAJ9076796.1 Calmodulin-2 [Entomophthora muscae]